MPRILAALAALTLVAATLAVPAVAKRPPTASERAAIRSAVEAFVQKEGSPAARDNRVVLIRVSTVNRRWASANLRSRSAGPAVAILKKRGQTWRVVQFGSAIGCNAAPKAVLRDLLGGCEPA